MYLKICIIFDNWINLCVCLKVGEIFIVVGVVFIKLGDFIL